MTLKGLSLLLGGWGSKLGREKSTLMILSALKIHTYLCTNQQIHNILKAEDLQTDKKVQLKLKSWDEKCESYRSSIYHSLGATLCTSMFNICLLQCVIGKSIFTLQMQNSLSSRLSLCDAPPLGNRREDLQLETSRENLWPCRSSRFFLGRDNLILTAKKTKNEGYYYLKNKCLIQVSTLSLKVPNPLSD